MKNRKGFTLIELLATLVILSVIMLIAVPNTISILDKNRKESMISDAKRFVALAESEIRNNDKIDTSFGGFIVFRLSDLNDGSLDKDPDGKLYHQENSFVVVYKKGTAADYQFEYYVQMKGEKRGIALVDSRNLERNLVTRENLTENVSTAISNATGVASPEVSEYKDLIKEIEEVS